MDDRLLQLAKKIPSLGMGGISVYPDLIKYATSACDDEAIIDIGSWLGSTTAFLLLSGRGQSGAGVDIHCYDRWLADDIFQEKAKRTHGIQFKLGEDISPTFLANVKPFGKQPTIHKGDFLTATYDSEKKISLIVDDICTGKEMTDHLFDIFEKHMIPGRTIIMMMDYWFFEHRKETCRLYQHDMMAANVKAGVFESLGRPTFDHHGKKKDTRTEVFRYLGGMVKRIEGEKYYERLPGQGYIFKHSKGTK